MFVIVLLVGVFIVICFFFFNDTATTEIYTLSLHDALPISFFCLARHAHRRTDRLSCGGRALRRRRAEKGDRKSTRLNSSHSSISYAVFCCKKKTKDLTALFRFILIGCKN